LSRKGKKNSSCSSNTLAISVYFLPLLPAKSGAVSRMIVRSLAIAEMMNLHSLNLSIVESLS
jgi:hypothetical protein